MGGACWLEGRLGWRHEEEEGDWPRRQPGLSKQEVPVTWASGLRAISGRAADTGMVLGAKDGGQEQQRGLLPE